MVNFDLNHNRYKLNRNLLNKLINFNLLYFLYNSYNKFFNKTGKNGGLNYILNKIFPIKLNKRNLLIKYMGYKINSPIKNYYYCIKNGLTYFVNLKIRFCLHDIVNKFNYNCESIHVSSIPMMSRHGSFVIEGIEKTIVSKFVRSSGVYLIIKKIKKEKLAYIKILINFYHDIDFIINQENLLILQIGKKEISLIHFLKVLGLNTKDIINNFYDFETIIYKNEKFFMEFKEEFFMNISLPYDVFNNEVLLIKKNTLITEENIDKIKSFNIKYIDIPEEYLLDKIIAEDIIRDKVNIAPVLKIIDNLLLIEIKKTNIDMIKIIHISSVSHYSIILSLMQNDCKYFRSLKIVGKYFKSIGFCITNINNLILKKQIKNLPFIDISSIRRILSYKLNRKTGEGGKLFDLVDFIDIIKVLIALKDNLIVPDDMHSLGSLNLLSSGDMLYNLFYKFFSNFKKYAHKIKLNYIKYNFDIFPSKIFNFQTLDSDVKDLFFNSKFSQFLDQINILSELSHKRKLSFLGVLGVSKKHSGFDVRDLNLSYYSKLCPVETPEGLNIGLIGSLSLISLIDENKLLISPYYKVKNRKIINQIKYLNNTDESDLIFTDSSVIISQKKIIQNKLVNARCNQQLIYVQSELVNYIDILPYQILSASASLIPFIEHNDSNRALMASNMLRQALPCLFPQRPVVGTGVELLIGLNSRTAIKSKSNAIIDFVDPEFILLKNYIILNGKYLRIYKSYLLHKYRPSNQNTAIIQRPASINSGKKIKSGDILVDGNCTDKGELSLGQNVVVAFMNWGGYNFEDSIIVSEKLIIDERYTSLDLLEIEISVYNKKGEFYDTLTNKFYSFEKKKLANLDKYGLIKIGSLVASGDILVGKITRYYEDKMLSNFSNENKLINSIFYKDEINYVDTSFYLPNNFNLSTVTNVEVYFSNEIKLNHIDKIILEKQINRKFIKKQSRFNFFYKKLKFAIAKFISNKKISNFDNEIYELSFNELKNWKLEDLLNLSILDCTLNNEFKKFSDRLNEFLNVYNKIIANIKRKFIKNLSPGVAKSIKVFLIKKKRLQLGDKMSGRHGNKGVISKILPLNEMPYMGNGVPVDIILNPLGVPSRMNIGQLLEIHLGLISLLIKIRITDLLEKNNIKLLKKLIYDIYFIIYDKLFVNYYSDKEIIKLAKLLQNEFCFTICNFDKFKESKINNLLNIISSEIFDIEFSDTKKQVYLYDGKSGKKFDNPITVGIMYMLKLNHLSEDKIHSRSIGPYSLITQQPLKGKSNLGGQRVGEMEVWALEAYGASFTLRDMLTIKSDDIRGRNDLYKSIINGLEKFIPGRPESFDVMLNNINCLGIYIRFIEN